MWAHLAKVSFYYKERDTNYTNTHTNHTNDY